MRTFFLEAPYTTPAISALMLAMLLPTNAQAAEQDDVETTSASSRIANTGSEIVVTARRREETLMQAPVVASVVSGDEILKANVQSISSLQEIVPTLRVQRGFGGQVGSVVNIRGIGSGTSAGAIDQSVGLAVDQVGFSHGSFYDAAVFDLARVEVLRGPQGLFFGKSTTAGIISLTTANPTPDWEASVTGAYEFNANEASLNGYISGPVAENLGIRLAGFYNILDGYLYNPNPAGSAAQRRVPDGHSEGGRLTLDFDSGPLHVNLKGSLTNSFSHGEQQSLRQFVSCPLGHPQNSFFQYDNCKLDKYNIGESAFPPYDPTVNWLDSAGDVALFQSASPLPQTKPDGSGFIDTQTSLISSLIEYGLGSGLTLTSVTGFGKVNSRTMQQGYIISLGPYQLYAQSKSKDFSQELRLSSDWRDGFINFMIGALYNKSNLFVYNVPVLPNAAMFAGSSVTRRVETKSAFGQILINPIEDLEVSGGLRYTHVRESFPYASVISNIVGYRPGDPNDASINEAPFIPKADRVYAEDNASPEFTATYHPTQDLTVFASYKWGYKGPGYNVGTFLRPTTRLPGTFVAFGGEKVRGAEAGVKASVLDRQLNLSLAFYHYKFLKLQVSHYDATRGISLISNGADAVTKGMELGVNFVPRGIPGLHLDAFVAYNDAKYSSFPTSPCYGGQTDATGCFPVSPTSTTRIQDLTGQRLQFAPRWTGNINISYEMPVTDGYNIRLKGGLIGSSRYNYTPANSPHGWQDGWVTVDGSLSLARKDDRIDISLVGRNLTNKYYVVTGFDSGQITPGVLSDLQGIANRSRQIMLQVTVHTGG